MQTPYKNIGEAHTYSAFITGADGHDKASILRRTLHSYEDPAKVPVLDDDEWQRLLYLIDAAPRLLEVVLAVYPWLTVESEINGDTLSDHDQVVLNHMIARARIAIDLATEGKP